MEWRKKRTNIILLNFDHEPLSVLRRGILRVGPGLEREIERMLLFLRSENVIVIPDDTTITIPEVCEMEFVVSKDCE